MSVSAELRNTKTKFKGALFFTWEGILNYSLFTTFPVFPLYLLFILNFPGVSTISLIYTQLSRCFHCISYLYSTFPVFPLYLLLILYSTFPVFPLYLLFILNFPGVSTVSLIYTQLSRCFHCISYLYSTSPFSCWVLAVKQKFAKLDIPCFALPKAL